MYTHELHDTTIHPLCIFFVCYDHKLDWIILIANCMKTSVCVVTHWYQMPPGLAFLQNVWIFSILNVYQHIFVIFIPSFHSNSYISAMESHSQGEGLLVKVNHPLTQLPMGLDYSPGIGTFSNRTDSEIEMENKYWSVISLIHSYQQDWISVQALINRTDSEIEIENNTEWYSVS